jgi:hypothetical protein
MESDSEADMGALLAAPCMLSVVACVPQVLGSVVYFQHTCTIFMTSLYTSACYQVIPFTQRLQLFHLLLRVDAAQYQSEVSAVFLGRATRVQIRRAHLMQDSMEGLGKLQVCLSVCIY